MEIDFDYERARRRGRFKHLMSVILSRCNALMSMAEATCGPAPKGAVALPRIEQVPLDRIVGSVGRSQDFDSDFNPLNEGSHARWQRVNQAFLQDIILPPVELQKLGDDYFVVDGHHRVSVARYHGMAFIDAEVTQYGYCPLAAAA
jgi:hypothetical protein